MTIAPPVRLDLNESFFPPLPSVTRALAQSADAAHRYPEFRPERSRRVVADHLRADGPTTHGANTHRPNTHGANTDGAGTCGFPLTPEHVTVGPGGTAVAHTLLAAAVDRAARRGVLFPEIVTATPTFDGFALIADALGARLVGVGTDPAGRPDLHALRAAIGPATAAVIICSPHNPTGACVDGDALRRYATDCPDGVRILLDQAYVEYCTDPPDLCALLEASSELVVLRTLSKAYGLAAVRIGYAVGHPSVITETRRFEMPFAVSSAAAAALPVALAARTELAQRVAATRAQRDRLVHTSTALGWHVPVSQANFVYLPGAQGRAAGRLLAAAGLHGRTVGDHGFRLTVADAAVTDRVLDALAAGPGDPLRRHDRSAGAGLFPSGATTSRPRVASRTPSTP
ncbi:aminotransferase class I/II-fold pyridoxal phosphate-dependent enzyme [Gordonia sp. NB41Y]|uniref:pyridoxal phosphate-dependent aminotransferase n=1 Tax=Gordonia sp. NB41Y TaxID=875808 RepID=UPI0009EA463B|nr:aminotransferase class I/II-fold pyridoxal phosphate-dependent enzyme [Gordonia sp. NB41Y]WLP90934.1 aminotransferase class I/II-fold pyridoxal phosphate-dependent enzyme [Gordonia sp. NB41Y]